MERYKNLNGNSGIVAYEIGEDFVRVKFSSGGIYLYTNESAGKNNLYQMKKLAVGGRGLNSFINRYVKYKYAIREQ